MNLKALYDLKERLEYSAIAGTGLLKEDFRLKRTVDNLAPLASASPVFAKISASAGKLLEASEKELSKQLLDVLSLVDAVIYTQGKKIVPLLKDGFEPCGKKDMVRRAMLIKELAGVDEKLFVGKYIKSHPLNCRCDTFVNITSPTQLQDGTTYDSINIIHRIYMKSIEIYSGILVFSSISSSQVSVRFSEVVNFSFTGYEKFFPIFWKPYSIKLDLGI